MTKGKLMQGNEACAQGAIVAGARFFAGYPISPATEIAEYLAEYLPQYGGKYIQMEDEIASLGAVIGASIAGVKALTATSGPGFSLMQENLGFASMTETPCVIVNVQRGGPSTGMPTAPAQGDIMQTRWGTHGDHPIIVLMPSSVLETFTLTITAFNLAEKFRVPVILLMDEVIAHMRENVLLPVVEEIQIRDRNRPNIPPEDYRPFEADEKGIPTVANFGEGYRFHITGLAHDRQGFPCNNPLVLNKLLHRLQGKIEKNKKEITYYELTMMEDAEIFIIACGAVARSAAQAVKLARHKGIALGLFKLITIWPFPDEILNELTNNAKKVVVVEMNMGQLTGEVKRSIGHKVQVEGLCLVHGELITPQEIINKVMEVL